MLYKSVTGRIKVLHASVTYYKVLHESVTYLQSVTNVLLKLLKKNKLIKCYHMVLHNVKYVLV